MTLVLSILMGLVPLLGIVWVLISGSFDTVDGLFMSLILLALSGLLLLNAAWEARDRGYLKLPHKRSQPAPAQTPQAQSVGVATPVQAAKPTPPVQKTTG